MKSPASHPHPSSFDASRLAGLVSSAGTAQFGPNLLAYLHQICGADHYAVFQFKPEGMRELAAGSLDGTDSAHRSVTQYLQQQFWRKDAAISEARNRINQAGSVMIKVEMRDIAGTELCENIYPRICERVLVAGCWRDDSFGLSILRTHDKGAFSTADLSHIEQQVELLVSLLGNHADLSVHRPNFAAALTSLDEIENCLAEMSSLPRREVEACARVLFGMCTLGISLDLGISEHSVKTYRKRAYDHLEIGSARELLIWYLGLWSTWHGHRSSEASHRMARQAVTH